MKRAKCSAEFKAAAGKQVIEREHSVMEASSSLGVSDKSLWLWVMQATQLAAVMPHY